jgi:hypothetical protein
LLALADEIGADPEGSADHTIAHVRLEWWQREAERFARGQPQHPWLRTLLAEHPSSSSLNLQPLVEGAALDLATRTLGAGKDHGLRRAVFALLASALCAQPLSSALQTNIGELGAAVETLESNPSDAQARSSLARLLGEIDDALQPQLAPLLVWLALAARPIHRRTALLQALSDNLVAWSAARRAARGEFRLQ